MGPLTCWVAVAGLAWRPSIPAVEILLAALAVWPSCVVAAAVAVPTVARAAEELEVEGAVLRAAAAVAGWRREVQRGCVRCPDPGRRGLRASLPVLNK